MNRQKRRALSKIKETEAKYVRQIEKRESIRSDATIQCYMVGVGLAVYELYGKEGIDNIVPLVQEVNRQICRIYNERAKYSDLAAELYRKTGIEFTWADVSEMPEDRR